MEVDDKTSTPHPDPTIEGQKALNKEVEHLEALAKATQETIIARLAGMDEAINLAREGNKLVPGQIDEKILCEARVLRSEMSGMQREIELREGFRVELAAATQRGVEAALIAQKDQVALQTIASDKATGKSEGVAIEAISSLGDTITSDLGSLRREIVAATTRIERIEAGGTGQASATEAAAVSAERQRTIAAQTRATILGVIAAIASIIGIIGIILSQTGGPS